MKSLNKNISVWRGNATPPTEYHLWVKDDGSIWIRLTDAWQCLATVLDNIKIDDLSLKIEKLFNLHIEENPESGEGIRKSYSLKLSDDELLGVDINIPTINELKDVKVGYANATISNNAINIGYSQYGENPNYILYLVYDGKEYNLIRILFPNSLTEGEGVSILNNKINVKIDSESSTHLTVSEKGLKFTDYQCMSIEDIENKFNS